MRTSRRLFLALLASLAPLAFASAQDRTAPAAEAGKGAQLLERVAVLGASVSAGHGLGKDPAGVRLTLAKVIEAGLAAKHGHVLDASSRLAFADTLGSSKTALGKLEKQGPTLVVALDYLFWFGYGTGWNGEKERLAGLELGLKSLESLDCPILLGDFPDMRSALRAPAPVLPALAVPEPETLAKLNARLAEWAAQHRKVVIVPVSRLMAGLLAGEELRVGPNLWPKGTISELLQDDGLHTTIEGTTALWLFAVERLLESQKDLSRELFEPKAGTIVAKLAPGATLRVTDAPIPEKSGKTNPAKIVH